MSNSLIETDLTIIGSGMAGMAAALFASAKKIPAVMTGTSGEILFASGLVDLMGVHPIAEKKVWEDPWAAMERLNNDLPDHPYNKLSRDEIETSLSLFTDFFKRAGVPYSIRGNKNSSIITSIGTIKTTYCLPESMVNGATALEEKKPCLIIDFRGMKDFSSKQIRETLKKSWPGIKSATLSFPGSEHLNEVFPERMARAMDLTENRTLLAELIKPLLKDAASVGMPAMMGLYKYEEVMKDLEEKIGVPVFEIPTMPVSVPGLRIKESFEKELERQGVSQLKQSKVTDVTEKDGAFFLTVKTSKGEFKIKSKGVILASGRFLGGGLNADRKKVSEPIFNLPVTQPESRNLWHGKNLFDPAGHPVNSSGLETDNLFRPLNKDGNPHHRALFATGSILAHQDWMRMKCGSGLAIATAFAAVNAFTEL